MIEGRRRARELVQVVAAVMSAATGLALALLPHAWIESTFGIDPDGGSGLFELLPVVVLLAAAALLARRVVRSRRSAPAHPDLAAVTHRMRG